MHRTGSLQEINDVKLITWVVNLGLLDVSLGFITFEVLVHSLRDDAYKS